MFVLRVNGTTLYIAIVNGFFERVETVNQAFQMGRQTDAQALQTILVDATEIVSV